MTKLQEIMGWTKEQRRQKREYKAYVARVDALPTEYKFVFKQIEKYLWEFSDFTGQNTLSALEGLVQVFEDGVANQISVFEITGDDVGEFANDIVREIADTWIDQRKVKLNKKINHYRKTGAEN